MGVMIYLMMSMNFSDIAILNINDVDLSAYYYRN